MTHRPDCILHWSEIETSEPRHYSNDDEAMELDAAYSPRLGLERLGIHHVRLAPGRRTSYPHAESAEEEFVYVLEGTPDVWLDGHLHRLAPGDAVGFAPGTGLSHCFINDTDDEVRLLVVGEREVPGARILYPLNPERRPLRPDWWEDAPARDLGPHDGLPAAVRLRRAEGGTGQESDGRAPSGAAALDPDAPV
ncbi:cupin domain-containing protein [Acidimangrovimonas sediminis]|uniref:cupin domain-containing protein n=1 Tax=Acidimangrovimonas sediminis TaxID=2056283 RepID=UPI000C7FB6CE|nr:cupin domain-containing protein [Acidimangrovimonas sediminis]